MTYNKILELYLHSLHFSLLICMKKANRQFTMSYLCRNGGFETSPLIGHYCGTTVDNPIISHSSRLWLRFHSDNSMSAPGFQIVYDGTASGCVNSRNSWHFVFQIVFFLGLNCVPCRQWRCCKLAKIKDATNWRTFFSLLSVSVCIFV